MGGSLAGGSCGALPVPLIWSCTPQHPQLCACGLEPPARGQWPEWGWGSSWPQQSSLCPRGLGLSGAGGSRGQSWGLSVTPQAARAPQAVHGPDLPEAPACGFCFGFGAATLQIPAFSLPHYHGKCPPNPGAAHPAVGGAVTPPFIHLLLLGQLPQAAGRAQQETSTLRFCQRRVGPCRSPLQPRARAGAPGPGGRWFPLLAAPSPEDRGFLVLCPQPQSGSPQADTLPRPRSGRAAPPCPASPAARPGDRGHRSQLCVSVLHPAPRAAVRGCSACWALYIL